MKGNVRRMCRDCRDVYTKFPEPRGRGWSHYCPPCSLPMSHPMKPNNNKVCMSLRGTPLTVIQISLRTGMTTRQISGALYRMKRKAVKKGKGNVWMLTRQSYKEE